MKNLLLSSVVALAVFPGTAVAQAGPSPAADPSAVPAPAEPCIPVHTRASEPGEPAYGLWAGGTDYKARFDGGMTFVPRLGRSYPHNQPFAWRTASVRVGEVELLRGEAPRLTHGALRVEYAHGPVVEAYDVLPHGLEQTFVIARRPAAAGDLCITGELTTALWTPAVAEHAGDLVFRDAAGAAILRYGRALAIDADGDCFVMTTTSSSGAITLRLPAADLARADFPLLVDPLLSTAMVWDVGSVADVGDTDAASEAFSNSYNTAFGYTRHFSATDSDVLVRLGAVTLNGTSAMFYDTAATASADHVRVAYVAATNRWVVVYQNRITATQVMQIRAATFLGNNQGVVTTNSVPHLLAAGSHEWRPVVGGIAAGGAGTKALVVYQQENGTAAFANTATSRVMGALFDTSTPSGSWGTPFVIQGGASEDVERPSVNRAAEGGAAFSWFVACQAFSNSVGNDDWDLIGRLVGNTGALSANAWISSLGTMHKLGPVVDGRSGRYCVAFSTASSTIGKNLDAVGTELRCERLDWAHGESAPSAAGNLPAETLASNQYRVLEANGIAHNGDSRSHWAIVWRSSSTAPALYAARVGYRGKPLHAADLVATTGLTEPGRAAVLHNDRFGSTVVCWQAASTSAAQVYSRPFDLPAAASASQAGSACTPAQIAWVGPAVQARENQRIGGDLAGPAVTGAPANSLHVLLVATATADLPLVDPMFGSSCSLLVAFGGPDYLGYLPLAVGSEASWQLPLPESLSSLTVHFQDWVLDPVDSRLRGTRRLTVPLVK